MPGDVARLIGEVCEPCQRKKKECTKPLKAYCQPFASSVVASAAISAALSDGASACKDPTSSCYPSYYRRQDIEPCPDQKLVESLNGESGADLALACRLDEETSGASLAVTAIAGLQDFLVERAKAEASTYAVDELGARLCADKEESKNTTAENFVRSLFTRTCAIIQADEFELSEATLRRLRQALVDDLTLIPGKLIERRLDQLKDPEQEQRAGLVLALGMVEAAVSVVKGTIGLPEVPARWRDETKAGYNRLQADHRLKCSLNALPFSPWCVGLFVPDLSLAVVELAKGPGQTPEQVAAAIERAAVRYCEVYAPPGPDSIEGACLLNPSYKGAEYRATFEALARAAQRLAALQNAATKLAAEGATPSEIAGRVLPDLALTLEGIIEVLPKQLRDSTEVAIMALRAAAAMVARDYVTATSSFVTVVSKGSTVAGIEVPDGAVRAIEFGARLAAAKNRDEAKAAIEDEALPLGSYKIKYDRSQWTIMINAYVGTFVAQEWQMNGENDRAKDGFAARPLTAPIGIDFTLPSDKYFHGGLLLALVDPFAAGTVDTDGEAQELDWGALLDLGLYLRVGLGGSPFTLLGGVGWQPLTRSTDDCTLADGEVRPCWKGAVHVGAAVAVDVPLLRLH